MTAHSNVWKRENTQKTSWHLSILFGVCREPRCHREDMSLGSANRCETDQGFSGHSWNVVWSARLTPCTLHSGRMHRKALFFWGAEHTFSNIATRHHELILIMQIEYVVSRKWDQSNSFLLLLLPPAHLLSGCWPLVVSSSLNATCYVLKPNFQQVRKPQNKRR